MVGLPALETAGRALRWNPIVLAAAATHALYAPTHVLQASGNIASNLVESAYSLLIRFVAPSIAGGVLATANDAIDSRTDWGLFVGGGTSNYSASSPPSPVTPRSSSRSASPSIAT